MSIAVPTTESKRTAAQITESTALTATDKTQPKNRSEDTLIFGSTPSQLYDEIAIKIDNLLTEEISSLPLLPRKKNDDEKPSGEEILLGNLRKAYKKNLDLVEVYCSRNVFTISSLSKTKRRKVLEHFLNGEERTDKVDKETEEDFSIPQSKFDPPPKDEEMPTPQQIVDMDCEILLARQNLHAEKQRRVQLSRQINRLKGGIDSLHSLRDALNGDGDKNFDELQDMIRKAVEGHQEIKALNERAENVIQLLDKIKEERGGGNVAATINTGDATSREVSERHRRRLWEEMNGGESGPDGGDHPGYGEGIGSLLKKLREK